MIVAVNVTQAGYVVELEEPDDFKGFKVVARGLAPAELDDALRFVGHTTGEGDAFIDVSAVKRLAGGRAQQSDWLASLDAMVEYAKSKGWMSGDGDSIRAHCELAGAS